MSTVELVVDEALGPGLDVRVVDGAATIAGERSGGVWLGLDRGHVAESDAGDGRELAAVVALPTSSFAGGHLSAELAGVLVDGNRSVVVARLPSRPLPPLAVLRTVGRIPEGAWLDAAVAERLAREARQRHRVRSQQGRVVGGRAWQAATTDPGERRFTTPHSRSEYRLNRLPPRFVRGLEGLLDDDERIIYAIERPPDSIPAGPLGFVRRGAERRAGLLLLTDRQLIWMVDHVPPDRYLMDWGVDGRLVAIEALSGVRLSGHDTVRLHAVTAGGESIFPLPAELRAEAEVMRDLLARFVPPPGGSSCVRRYEPAVAEFDPRPAELFGQLDEARRHVEIVRDVLAPEELVASFYAPRREVVRHPTILGISRTRVALLEEGRSREVPLASLRDISMTLSPLVGRVELASAGGEVIGFTYPATLSSSATPVLRRLRSAWADAASRGGARADATVCGEGSGAEVRARRSHEGRREDGGPAAGVRGAATRSPEGTEPA